MEYISNTLGNLVEQTAFMNLTFGNLIMIAVACVFLYLAIRHEFEPLLLVPIAFGMLLVNIYPDIMLHAEDAANGTGGEIRRKSIRIRIEKDRLCCCRRECGQQTGKGQRTE